MSRQQGESRIIDNNQPNSLVRKTGNYFSLLIMGIGCLGALLIGGCIASLVIFGVLYLAAQISLWLIIPVAIFCLLGAIALFIGMIDWMVTALDKRGY